MWVNTKWVGEDDGIFQFTIPIAVQVNSTPFNWCFFVPNIFIIVMSFSIDYGEQNDKRNFTMVFISFYGDINIHIIISLLESVVGEHLMREEPLTGIDFIILIILFSIVIYCFKYIRNHR